MDLVTASKAARLETYYVNTGLPTALLSLLSINSHENKVGSLLGTRYHPRGHAQSRLGRDLDVQACFDFKPYWRVEICGRFGMSGETG